MNALPEESQKRLHRQTRQARRALRRARQADDTAELRVLGPYRNRATWRVVLVEGPDRKSLCVASYDEALSLITACQQEVARTQTCTIGTSLDQYQTYLCTVRQVLPSTAEHVHQSLAGWLPVSMLVRSLTEARAQRLYDELSQDVRPRTGRVLAVATQQFFLASAKSWGRWACHEHLLSVNPFAAVAPVGKRHCGKMQLRLDEARQLANWTQARADAGDPEDLAILLMLHMGLRQGEVGARVARDVDDDGTLLWIPTGKTMHAARRLQIPECLRGPLVALARTKEPGELLFTQGTQVPGRQHFWGVLHQFCRHAGVPLVCPHSLRGLHASVAITAGATGRLVAEALEHGSFAVTARHYATAESLTAAHATRVTAALGPKEDAVSRLLAELSPEQREELKKRLG